MLKEMLILSFIISLQTSTFPKITGKIIDKQTQEELVGVRIISDSDTTYSDINGDFEINTLTDTSNLIFYFISYQSNTLNVNTDYEYLSKK